MPSYVITTESDKETIIKAILALDISKPIRVALEILQKRRTIDQNALYWSGPLKDIANQAVVESRLFSAESWHQYFKQEFLPEEQHADIAKLVINLETYRKWDVLPNGEMNCIASTTDLTPKGFNQFLEQVYAHGADLGVMFSANPRFMQE